MKPDDEKPAMPSSLSARLAALSPEKRALLEKRLRSESAHPPARRMMQRQGALRPPLSFVQQRLWFLDQLEPGLSFYNLPLTQRLAGPVALSAIERALNDIVKRHETLRTSFPLEDGEPVQEIAPELKLRLEIDDMRSTPPAQREAEAQKRATTEAMRPFDLQSGPLIRAKLLKLAEMDHLLVVTMHHIVSDGWSIGVLSNELNTLYTAIRAGRSPSLPELPMQYGDFAIWQRNYLRGETLERLLSHWKGKLVGMPALLELPTDRPRPRVQSFEGGSYFRPFPETHVEALKAIALEQEGTLFMALLAVFKILLLRFSGLTDIFVGAPIANRNHVELEGLIGLFVNTLVLRTDLSGNPTYREVLTRVREVTLEGYAHQDLPFERLVEEMNPDRNLSHNPLFQVMFGLQNTSRQLASHNSSSQFSFGTSKFDLTLSASETEEGLTCTFEFNRHLFRQETVASLVDAFGALIESAASRPDCPISDLPLVSTADRKRLIEKAATVGPFPNALLVHELFEAQVAKTPDAPAVTMGTEKLSYAQLNERANQLGRALRARGAGPDVLIGLCMDRALELPIGMLGVLKAGAAFLPLDPTYPKERLGYMLKEANAPILLTHSHLVQGLPPLDAEVWCLDRDWPRIAEQSQEPLERSVSPENLAYVIYTSGSTGRPKGVMVQHRSACYVAQAQIEVFGLSAGTRILQFGSLSFDASIFDLLMMIGCGGTLCLAPREALLPGQPLAQTLLKKRINVVTLPPSALGVIPVSDLPDLHTIVAGGEALPREAVTRWLGQRRLFNAYGPTEATIWATVFECRDSEHAPPIGRAIPNTEAYVLDGRLEPLPPGFPGELYLGGNGIARGYVNGPQPTAEAYLPDPWREEADARLYRTGDRVRLLPNGDIQFIGRVDHQLKLRGYRIELGEIESVLRSHPQVRDAAAVMQRTPAGEARIAAFCVTAGPSSPGRSELLGYLRKSLPDFMIPTPLMIVESLPLNPNGKLDRQRLSAWTEPAGQAEGKVALKGESEEKLAAIFREILETEQVGSEDSFFELGGHSLLATRAMNRINETFGVALPLRHLFEFPTVEGLAAAVEQAQKTGGEPAQPAIGRAARQTVTSPVGKGSP